MRARPCTQLLSHGTMETLHLSGVKAVRKRAHVSWSTMMYVKGDTPPSAICQAQTNSLD